MDPTFNLVSIMPDPVLQVERLCDLTGILLASSSLTALKTAVQENSEFLFVVPDIADITTKVRYMNVIDYAAGMSLFLRVRILCSTL